MKENSETRTEDVRSRENQQQYIADCFDWEDNYGVKDTIIRLVGRSSDGKNGSAEQA